MPTDNEVDKLEKLLVYSEAYIGIPYVETFRRFMCEKGVLGLICVRDMRVQ